MKKTVMVGKLNHLKLIKQYMQERQSIESAANMCSVGEITVRDTVYPGVRITISLGEMAVTSPVRFTTFICKEHEISLSPCRM